MNKRTVKSTAWLLIMALIFPLLAACGQIDLTEEYPLVSVAQDGNSTSYVYRAENTTVPEVAAALAEKRTPKETSKEDPQRMFLIYDDQMIQVMQDTEIPEDSLIEVDSLAYVQRNYDRSFLEMYFQYKLLSSLFDSLGGLGNGKYRGYTERTTYTPSKSYQAPTREDIQKAPPMTVQRKGSITKRGSKTDTTVGSGGNVLQRTPSSNSKGSIKRDDSRSNYSKSPTIKKSKTPRTRVGKGGITRRGRR